jgi:hypothetical protein
MGGAPSYQIGYILSLTVPLSATPCLPGLVATLPAKPLLHPHPLQGLQQKRLQRDAQGRLNEMCDQLRTLPSVDLSAKVSLPTCPAGRWHR